VGAVFNRDFRPRARKVAAASRSHGEGCFHLPGWRIGPNFAGYAESGLLAGSKGEFDAAMWTLAYRAPLLIIDGQHGVVQAGTLPLYRLPALLLRLLEVPEGGIFDYTGLPEGLAIRPLPGLQLVLEEGGGALVCDDAASPEPCTAVRRWNEQVQLLADDLFVGRQYALPAYPGPAGEGTEAQTAVL
jgi:hypothetical protein